MLGYHFDGKRHEEDDDVWRQTWVDVMTPNGEGKDARSLRKRTERRRSNRCNERKVEEDPNDYKRKEKKPQLTQKERETLALERLKKKREANKGFERIDMETKTFLAVIQAYDGGRNSQPSSLFGYRR